MTGPREPMKDLPAIETLRACVERFDGRSAASAADLGRALRDFAAHDDFAMCPALAALCASCSEAMEALRSDEQLAHHADAIRRHLDQLVDFAVSWSAAPDGRAGGLVTPPEPLRLRSDEADRLHKEAVAAFAGNALCALAELEEELLSLESGAELREDALSSVRRTVHTLKAEFGVLGMAGAQALCHEAETGIDAFAAADRHAGPLVDALLAFGDYVKQAVERLAAGADFEFDAPPNLAEQLRALRASASDTGVPAGDAGQDARVVLEVDGDFADSVPEFIGEARGHLADAEVAMVELSRDAGDAESLNLTFRAFHTIKGVAGFLNLGAIVDLAHAAETLLDGGRAGRYRFEAIDIDLVLAAGDMIQQLIAALEGDDAPRAAEWEHLKRALAARAEGERRASVDAPDGAADGPREPARASGPQGPVVPAQRPAVSKPARVERTVKVGTARLDMLVDMVGELVIAQSMVLQDPAITALDSLTLSRNISQVGKITRDLQAAAMSLRMVTVKATFQKMARLVRDVASKSGKQVELSIVGEDTELDRNVVEQISDPLVHMIRNAVDHGIEAPAERAAAGKREEGRLTLRAYHQGGAIVIEIRDDGRGIDRAKVLAKAVAKGLVAADADASTMTDAEVFNLIFAPGFSTAEAVTDLSGRGVGMDVVRRNIEALRGKIEIESELGHGTTFHLRLPLTLAIIDGMIVRVGSSRFVVPTLCIEHSFRPELDDVIYVADRGECVRVRGAVLPIYRLKELLGQADGGDQLEAGILVVVETDGQRTCLFVDEIVGQQQVVIKSLGVSREQAPGLSGGAIMTDGRVALILDVGGLVSGVLPATARGSKETR